MQELFSCIFLQVANSFLSNSVLEMSVDTAVADGLVPKLAMTCKSVVGEATIVAVIMANGDAMLLQKLFKGLLGCNGFN